MKTKKNRIQIEKLEKTQAAFLDSVIKILRNELLWNSWA